MHELNNHKLVKVIGSFAVPRVVVCGISGYTAYAGMILGIAAAVGMIGISTAGELTAGHPAKY